MMKPDEIVTTVEDYPLQYEIDCRTDPPTIIYPAVSERPPLPLSLIGIATSLFFYFSGIFH